LEKVPRAKIARVKRRAAAGKAESRRGARLNAATKIDLAD